MVNDIVQIWKINAESSKIMPFSLSIEEIDPRIDRCKKHLACNICFLTIAAVFIRRFFMIIPTDKFEHLFRRWVIGVIGHTTGLSPLMAKQITMGQKQMKRNQIAS